jgi:hypothetical protein
MFFIKYYFVIFILILSYDKINYDIQTLNKFIIYFFFEICSEAPYSVTLDGYEYFYTFGIKLSTYNYSFCNEFSNSNIFWFSYFFNVGICFRKSVDFSNCYNFGDLNTTVFYGFSETGFFMKGLLVV